MLKLFRNLSKRDWLLAAVSIGFIVFQVYLDLKLPDYMSEITMLVQTEGSAMGDILLAGGKDKGVSYKDLGPLMNDHVKYLILCGATAKAIRESVEQAENYHGLPVAEVPDWAEAVRQAALVAEAGDVVVMSPASTSFDRFPNFMEKGKFFKEQVNALA